MQPYTGGSPAGTPAARGEALGGEGVIIQGDADGVEKLRDPRPARYFDPVWAGRREPRSGGP
jgi:hypothetical protein